MRLICPNCDAQYEVPDDVMPPEGRDVQCSNCGNTWYQSHPDEVAAAEAVANMEPQEDEEFVSFDTPEPEPAEEEEAFGAPDHPDHVEETPPPTPPADRPAPTRRELDPSVADVLRAEAELEEQARRNEMGSMESQPELGLSEGSDDAGKRAREARERMARMRGEPPSTAEKTTMDASTAADLGSRRDLLPDIEEINSTLRSNNDRSPATDPGQTAQIEVQEQRSSRLGFVFAVALVAVLALAYAFAPQIVNAVPQLEAPMSTYAAMIDTWRDWLDAQVTGMLSWLDQAATSTGQ
ncbi:MAG: zinc-ribbon domain-containing protein [Roseobacter sp.]